MLFRSAEGVGPSWPFMLVLSSPVVVSDLFRELEEGVLVSSHLVHRELVRFDIGFKSRRMVKLSGKQLAYARRFHQMTSVRNGLLRSAADGIGISQGTICQEQPEIVTSMQGKLSTTQASDGAIVPYSELASIGSPQNEASVYGSHISLPPFSGLLPPQR